MEWPAIHRGEGRVYGAFVCSFLDKFRSRAASFFSMAALRGLRGRGVHGTVNERPHFAIKRVAGCAEASRWQIFVFFGARGSSPRPSGYAKLGESPRWEAVLLKRAIARRRQDVLPAWRPAVEQFELFAGDSDPRKCNAEINYETNALGDVFDGGCLHPRARGAFQLSLWPR